MAAQLSHSCLRLLWETSGSVFKNLRPLGHISSAPFVCPATRYLSLTTNQSTSSSNQVSRPRARRQEDVSCPSYATPYDPVTVDHLLSDVKDDMPLSDMPDPYEKTYRRCFLCEMDIKLDHKNVRLLSQFVSPYTGRIYSRAITGLCIPMQREVSRYIKRARNSGYMPYIIKDPKYLKDPQPYDAMKKF